MQILSTLLVALVALEHVWILVLEMFLWQKPIGLKTFDMTPEKAAISASLAANQGLYNGFLAAGLIYGLLAANPDVAWAMKSFFLICVLIAGLYAGVTVKPRIFYVQGLPALLALVVLFLS